MKLKQLLDGIEEATGIHPTAFNTTDINTIPAINYLCYRASDNGAKEQWRFQTRVTARTYEQALHIEDLLTKSLVTLGDNTNHGCVIRVNGGGTLEDEATGFPQIMTYFDLITKGA